MSPYLSTACTGGQKKFTVQYCSQIIAYEAQRYAGTDKPICRKQTDLHAEKIHEDRCTATSRQTDVHTYKET